MQNTYIYNTHMTSYDIAEIAADPLELLCSEKSLIFQFSLYSIV